MPELRDFIGTWKTDPHPSISAHTLTWQLDAGQLRGRWTIAATIEAAGFLMGRPRPCEMRVGRAWIDDGVLLFHVNGAVWPSEFRLAGDGEAVLGSARHKLSKDTVDRHHAIGSLGLRLFLAALQH